MFAIRLSLPVEFMGWTHLKKKMHPKIKCWGLTPFYFRNPLGFARFLFFQGPLFPPFSWGTPKEGVYAKQWPEITVVEVRSVQCPPIYGMYNPINSIIDITGKHIYCNKNILLFSICGCPKKHVFFVGYGYFVLFHVVFRFMAKDEDFLLPWAPGPPQKVGMI